MKIPTKRTGIFRNRSNPWELLAIAAFFLVGAIALLCQTQTVVIALPSGNWRRGGTVDFIALTPCQARFLGVGTFAIAAFFVVAYLKIRSDITGISWWDFRSPRKRPEHRGGG